MAKRYPIAFRYVRETIGDHLIRIADVDRTISGLVRCVKPGGLLVVEHAHFRLADTTAAGGFTCLLALPPDHGSPVYGRDDSDSGVYRAP